MQREGTILNDRYELLQRVGSGGMAVVYKSRDHALGRIVAIKLLHESLTSDEGFLKRFQQEAHSAANLSHPNIVTIHDIGQDGFRYFMVMEFIEGQTLKQVVRAENENGRFLPLDYVLDLGIQICDGIGYAHRAKLIHCDVKPQNIIVTPDGRIKVADFGISRAVSSATQQDIASQVWGTPQYFAPEQAAGDPMTPATDVYAIGIVLFEMLSGQLPFKAESHMALALKHIQTPPPPVSDFNPTVPNQLEQIVSKILAKEPSGRYRTAGQLSRILSTYRKSSQAETGTVRPVPVDIMKTLISGPPASKMSSSTPVAEQKTQIYQRPLTDQPTSTQKQPPHRQAPANIGSRETIHVKTNGQNNAATDWIIITLGIAALVALLGLIPLWWMAYLAWTS